MTLEQLLESLAWWSWWIIGIALIVLEMLAPGIVFLWLGIAAILTGVIVLVLPDLYWPWQLVAFSVLSLISVISGRAWFRRNPPKTQDTGLNRRGEQYVGRLFTLEEPVVNGSGKICVDDTTWKVEGPDLPVGKRVRIAGLRGVIFEIEEVKD